MGREDSFRGEWEVLFPMKAKSTALETYPKPKGQDTSLDTPNTIAVLWHRDRQVKLCQMHSRP